MPHTYGRQVGQASGVSLMVLANFNGVVWKPGGITIDWDTVTAVAADTTLDDQTVIKNGKKGIPYGTILCQKDVQEVQLLTISGSPTGGTFTLKKTGTSTETAAIAYNASAATAQAAIRALGGDYSDVLVTGSAGGPWTVTFAAGQGDIGQLVIATNSLTGGSSPTVAGTTSTAGSANGKYGPYDSAATDGRQNLTRGFCYILNETVLEESPNGLAAAASDHPAVFEGGLAWKARLRIGGTNPTYLGSGSEPAWSAFETAFPKISYAQ